LQAANLCQYNIANFYKNVTKIISRWQQHLLGKGTEMIAAEFGQSQNKDRHVQNALASNYEGK
jgi:uncharacterized protein YbcI